MYMYVRSLDHSDTNGNPKAKYNCSALTYQAGRGREPNAETDKLLTLAFLLARGKMQRCRAKHTRSIKYPPSCAMGRPDL